jgi:hypothetical protein
VSVGAYAVQAVRSDDVQSSNLNLRSLFKSAIVRVAVENSHSSCRPHLSQEHHSTASYQLTGCGVHIDDAQRRLVACTA